MNTLGLIKCKSCGKTLTEKEEMGYFRTPNAKEPKCAPCYYGDFNKELENNKFYKEQLKHG
jgi:phage FluMu protein Com